MEVLELWKTFPAFEASQEFLTTIKQQFLGFYLEDEVKLKAESIDKQLLVYNRRKSRGSRSVQAQSPIEVQVSS